MKFAKDLERELVPEWKAKYLNYKATGLGSVTQRYAGDLINAAVPERSPLRAPASRFDQTEGYGSIVPPRPSHTVSPSLVPSSLQLPDPAIDQDDNYFAPRNESSTLYSEELPAPNTTTQRKSRFGQNIQSGRGSLRKQIRDRRPTIGPPGPRPSFIHRIFSSSPEYEPSKTQMPAREQALAELRTKETEFFAFMDKELAKIETFYKLKEDESTKRLQLLREQLHVMRDSRIEELRSKKNHSMPQTKEGSNVLKGPAGQTSTHWTRPLTRGGGSHIGKTTKAMTQLATPRGPVPQAMADEQRDFVTRREYQGVPYSSAKRKLKRALLEFYRGLELLKSYADLNRKAFRKINKKYDKVSYARPTGRYMTEKVNKAWFVQSDIVENHLVAVEDLYARYFERGNRKVATHKLRGKAMSSMDYSPNSFRNGLLLAAGLVFAIQGLYYAIRHLFEDDLNQKTETSYLLQIYGGYFLILVHFLLFCLDCRIWSMSKINYIFVFEYDTRHVLDWRQLSESLSYSYPRVFYTTGAGFGGHILIGGYSLQGFIPWNFVISFSVTCTAPRPTLWGWDNPVMCNSSHSRVFGFVTTVPSIWRGFQCLRRYYDTRNAFPHLVNFGKYSFSILYYLTLSLYRIDKSTTLRGMFITFACLNAIYASVWDLAMDWSLCNPYSKNPYLRDYLGFQRRWVYYVAMIVDPILRFNWILYAVFIHDMQHSAVLSFAVALSEVCRRGMWTIFRVENEHCTNVGRFRASRDIPLPYDMSLTASDEERLSTIPPAPTTYTRGESKYSPPHALGRIATNGSATYTPDLENGVGTPISSLRRRRFSQREDGTPPSGTLARVGTMLATAHAQDFERKKRPSILDGKGNSNNSTSTDEDEGEDEEEDDDNEGHDDGYEAHISEESEQSASNDNGRDMLSGLRNSGSYGGPHRRGK
ncbi:conserved hypothetical protein [Microsporum canis CBS 113480]|uniref:Signal transduction protein Syg1 n=1 Tax=Arthroderma otae (strain ATCC MYA-4605 / CBS 113480) TaxID=554155 RepID=C5FII1_ARTOC|nr:conserved hypothetical protein [Microsporum canis CBS 113480]EEQ29250.1 conserved hypothetical protein [Microsporum canis CBS 113480]